MIIILIFSMYYYQNSKFQSGSTKNHQFNCSHIIVLSSPCIYTHKYNSRSVFVLYDFSEIWCVEHVRAISRKYYLDFIHIIITFFCPFYIQFKVCFAFSFCTFPFCFLCFLSKFTNIYNGNSKYRYIVYMVTFINFLF